MHIQIKHGDIRQFVSALRKATPSLRQSEAISLVASSLGLPPDAMMHKLKSVDGATVTLTAETFTRMSAALLQSKGVHRSAADLLGDAILSTSGLAASVERTPIAFRFDYDGDNLVMRLQDDFVDLPGFAVSDLPMADEIAAHLETTGKRGNPAISFRYAKKFEFAVRGFSVPAGLRQPDAGRLPALDRLSKALSVVGAVDGFQYVLLPPVGA